MISCRADLFKQIRPKQLFRGTLTLKREHIDFGPVWKIVVPPSFTAPPSIIERLKKILIEVGFDQLGHFTIDEDNVSDGDLYRMIIYILERNGLEQDPKYPSSFGIRDMNINYQVMV